MSADELIIPVDENGDPENAGHGRRHRMPPMMQWCTIDTDARTVTTTLSAPVLTYYIIDGDDAVIVASSDAGQFADGVASLPSGAYTLRLVTASSTYSAPLDIE